MLPPFVRLDGSPFPDDVLAQLAADLSALDQVARNECRDRNADAIAALAVHRLLIVSGPGTGKSHLFLRRIEHWLGSDPGGGVLVTSFVRKLVQDLDRDLGRDSSLADDQKQRVRVFTLHKLARSIAEQTHGTSDWPFKPFFKIIAWPWRETVWCDVLALHTGDQDSTEVKAFEEYLHLNESTSPSWAMVRDTYFRLCQFYNAAGFADLILRAGVAVREHPEVIPEQYFIVDEYQDFNLAEQALLDAICMNALGVLFAGDDDQVLYETLKAGDPALIRGLYVDADIANGLLPFCGRCSHHITKAAAAFLSHHADSGRIGKLFLPLADPEQGSEVAIIGCATPGTVVHYVATWLDAHRDGIVERQRELKEGTKKEPYLLILTPSHGMKYLAGERAKLPDLISAFRDQGQSGLSEDYYNVAVFYSAGRHPDDNFEIRKALSLSGVGDSKVHEMIRDAMERGCALSDLQLPEIVALRDTSKAVVLACSEESDASRLAHRLSELIAVGDEARLAATLAARPLNDSAIAQLQREQEAAAEQQELGIPTAQAVELLTIVGAKGLSADHVMILGCDDVSLSHVSPKAFFVGLTRARKSLQLLVNIGGSGAHGPHQYLGQLPGPNVTHAKFTKGDGLVALGSFRDFADYFGRLAYARSKAGRSKH